MTKIEELKAAFEASTKYNKWEVLQTSGLPHVVCLTEDGVDVMTVAACGTNADAEFIALAHNMMPQMLEALELVGIIARMETDGEMQERTDLSDCMSGDDAAETLSNLIESARLIDIDTTP